MDSAIGYRDFPIKATSGQEQPGVGVCLDHIGRRTPGVPQAPNALNGGERGYSNLYASARLALGESMQAEPDRSGNRCSLWLFGITSQPWHHRLHRRNKLMWINGVMCGHRARVGVPNGQHQQRVSRGGELFGGL